MWKQRLSCVLVFIVAFICLASCGAMTLEPAAPEEPPPPPPAGPRLVRPDAGIDGQGPPSGEPR